jgi:hypothetical protein
VPVNHQKPTKQLNGSTTTISPYAFSNVNFSSDSAYRKAITFRQMSSTDLEMKASNQNKGLIKITYQFVKKMITEY